MGSKIKNIILFVGIGAALVVGYLMFFKPKPATPNLVTGTAGTTQNAVSTTNSPATDKAKENSDLAKQFLSLLLSVRSINLDNQIFADPAFISLKDSTIVLVNDGTEGRPNPFAPIGSDALPASAVFFEDAGNTQQNDTQNNLVPPVSPSTNTPPAKIPSNPKR